MKNSDFIQMKQCHVYSVKFPVDNVQEVLENAEFETASDFFKLEIVCNPMSQEKVQVLDDGIFFSFRTTFKKLTSELITAKVFELKNTDKFAELGYIQPTNEKEWKELASELLISSLPFSSEIINVFYSAEKELLFINSKSKSAQLALSHLIKLFELVGYRSIAVSEEKLGLNTKLKQYLESNQPLFKYLHFQHEATLRKQEDDDDLFLTCRHLDTSAGREKALEALNNGFKVQSLAVFYEKDGFAVNFKLDEHLKTRSLRFASYADDARELNKNYTVGKQAIFYDYISAQFNALLKIASCTVLEFVDNTKLEDFV